MALFDKKTNNAKKKDDQKKKVEIAPAATMKDLYKEDKSTAVKTDKKISGQAYRILVKPLVTEKAANLGHLNKYVFMVSNTANKLAVAQAVSEIYGIKPVNVNIVNMKGKKITRGRVRGARKDWRKAIVTLPKGKTITIYEGV